MKISLLGPPELEFNGRPLDELTSLKARALLYYLAVSGRPHPRQALANLLWGDSAEAAARASLRKAVQQLRDHVGGYVDAGMDKLTISGENFLWIDVAEFEALVLPQDAGIDQLQKGVALYRDDFCTGLNVHNAPEYEHWLLVERARLREHAVGALERLADLQVQAGELAQAIAGLHRLLALEPWSEATHRRLMTILAQDGRRSAALIQYELCCRMLEEELGVEPSTETQQLAAQIRANARDPIPGPRISPAVDESIPASPEERRRSRVQISLPTPSTDLVGRNREVGEITHLLQLSDCRMITVIGPGGIGKTRLAIAAAHEQRAGVWEKIGFVSLTDVEQHDFVAPLVAAQLGVAIEGAVDPRLQLIDQLRRSQVLLVFDGMEHLLSDTSLVSSMLAEIPGLKVVVTSREPLRLYGEWIFRLAGLKLPDDDAEDAIISSAAVQLFLQAARRADTHFSPDSADLSAVAHLCRRLEGMPLGIELAASWIRSLSCQEIADELDRDLHALQSTIHDLPLRHQSLSAVVEHSWELLPPMEQDALAACCVFRGGFNREAAARIAGADLNMLASLVDKSMLWRSEGGRHAMHEVVRHYVSNVAGARLSDAAQRHLTYYLELATVADAELLGAQQPGWLTQLANEHENLRAGLAWGLTHAECFEQGLHLAGALPWYWYLANHWREGARWTARFLAETDRKAAPYAWGRAKLAAGGMALILDQYGQAEALLNQAIGVFRREEQTRDLARALSVLGITCLFQGDLDLAQRRQTESLHLFRVLNDKPGYLFALEYMGQALLATGSYVDAAIILRECLALNHEIGYTISLPQTLIDLGRVERCLGEAASARDYSEQGLTLAKQLGVLRFQAQAHCTLAWLACEAGDPGVARQHFAQSVTLFHRLGDLIGVADCLDGFASVVGHTGDPQAAVSLLATAAQLREQIGVSTPNEFESSYSQTLTLLHECLDESEFQAAWRDGRDLETATVVQRMMEDK